MASDRRERKTLERRIEVARSMGVVAPTPDDEVEAAKAASAHLERFKQVIREVDIAKTVERRRMSNRASKAARKKNRRS